LTDPLAVLAAIDAAIDETARLEGEGWEKSPGEWVTERDIAIETILSEYLVSLMPGSRVLGEEAASDADGLLVETNAGSLWVVDPIDGTANYVARAGPVATMVALSVDGRTQLSCIRMHGGEALVASADGVKILDGGTSRVERGSIQHTPTGRGMISGRFLSASVHQRLRESLCDYEIVDGSGCAGRDYLDLVAGRLDFLVYERVLPWDHLPGAHAVQVMGGSVSLGDGSTYRGQSEIRGLVASRSRDLTMRLLAARQVAFQAC
jgi:fructose-1,6-bisphosphatase/inositol monophosphatase family enzyme